MSHNNRNQRNQRNVPALPALPTKRTSRRDFLCRAAAGGAALLALRNLPLRAEPAGDLPTRVLGRTKQKVTILGLGTAPLGEARGEVKEAARIFGEVMDRGVNYIDTARIYGIAEEAVSQLLPGRRDKLFLVTKLWTDSAAAAEKAFAESLRTLQVDHVDLVHIHNIGDKNLDKVQAADGILAYLLKQKQAGKLRFIGLSGHCRPPRFVEMLKTGQIDVVMGVMNYADCHTYNFEGVVLPECRKLDVGAAAMKAYVGIKGGFKNHRNGGVGCVTPAERLERALAYVLDLPGLATVVVGPFTLQQAIQNVEFARRYRPLTDQQREELLAIGKKIAAEIGPRYGPVA